MSAYEKPIATVDVALFTLRDAALQVLLSRRERAPYAGEYALPGGFVHTQEDADTAATARRVLHDKAGVSSPYLEQLYTFSGRDRDPRGWSISVVYFAVVPEQALQTLPAGSRLQAVDTLPALAFDHVAIVRKALARIRDKATYSSLPAFLLPETFTLPELHAVYGQVLGSTLDPASFRRKIESQGFIEPVPGARSQTRSTRPAQLYRLVARELRAFDRTI
ncbi:NUDIX hydrolase [Plasticicumulans acidivorans]|uniref:8-oxo-dGTP diphosphatase n=1 Tax=Plasticicumulans acidivorans TaxID=886464 RepID=A0A317MS24_9GAMM|nr:NUDIX domain-containing protein [Plasticicumulans acidivorans]PWV59830.1 8-oxo-dGTP diphosphatase [Plasticicumulans acidivorans]